MSERRKYARIESDQVISFSYLEEADRLAHVHNISVGGIHFEVVGCDINLGEILRVTFNVEDQTIVAVGRVVWATDTDPITTEVGLEFMEVEPHHVRLLEKLAGTPA